MCELGKTIKRLRITKKESQQDLADFLNISFQSVSKWENDIAMPDITLLKKIANHFDVTIDYLLDNVKEIPIKKNYFKIKLNCNSGFSVFTDKDDNPNISMLDPSYHRCDSLSMFKASDDQNKNI